MVCIPLTIYRKELVLIIFRMTLEIGIRKKIMILVIQIFYPT